MLAGMYLADNTMGSVWHHSMLMESRSQTIYGLSSKTGDHEYHLDWQSKGPSILGLLGGLDHHIAQRLKMEGKWQDFMASISPQPVTGMRSFSHPILVELN